MSLTKAKLIFMPLDKVKRQVDDQGSVKSGASGIGKIGSLVDQASKNVEKAQDALKKVESTMNKVGFKSATLTNALDQASDLLNSASGSTIDVITFQFNPSTLRISAYGGGMAPISNYGAAEGSSDQKDNKNGEKKASITYGAIQETITVDFKVIFDATKNTDAFMHDKLTLSPTNIVKTAVELVKQDVYSVRTIAEGFLAAVRDPDKRHVQFQWGSLNYRGTMNSVQCNYTMFNLSGEPIRAEISIRILATNARMSNGDSYNYTAEWKKRYEELIKQAKNNKISSSNASNIANNLLNLQL